MTPTRLWRVSVVAPASAEDAVSELFSRVFAAPSATYHDFESGKTTVSAFVSDPSAFRVARKELMTGLTRLVECGLIPKGPRLRCTKLQREDWAESWKKHFKPLEIRGRLLIKPSWSRRKAKKDQSIVVLDPGLSFGTGNHPTTAYCLRELARAATNEPGSFLDAGTGSGILAIAAAKLRFAPIDAFDFDAQAVAIAKGNARRNGVARQIRFFNQDALKFRTREKYALICANLSTEVLKKTIRVWANCLAPAGCLVLAGILKTEFNVLASEAEKCGLRILKSRAEKEWCSGTFRQELAPARKHI